MRFTVAPFVVLAGLSLSPLTALADQPSLKVAAFRVDATPPIGSPVAYAPARKVEDPLSARGIVLLGAGQPIVLCAVDWIGISNEGNRVFREKLAIAAGTVPERVTVHTLHQHDAPRCDFRAEEIMHEFGRGGERNDDAFCRQVIENTAAAIRKAIPEARPVTHLGVGKANIEKVASNRRILGPDGKVKIVRYSASKDPAAQAAPEGVIDPELKLISLWEGDRPVASLTYFATHPQSYYGKGDVTAEFVGLARARREAALPDVAHIHFNGASGNVAAGKYNDGSPAMRVVLTDRMEDGMRRAWEATEKSPLIASDVGWQVETVELPVAPHLDIGELREKIRTQRPSEKGYHAVQIAFAERSRDGRVAMDLSRLRLKNVSIVHMPGELFVEYQLAAQKMCPEETVCMAAYGDYAPGYIGTEIAYSQGGYETEPRSSSVSPDVEKVLLDGLRKMLSRVTSDSATDSPPP